MTLPTPFTHKKIVLGVTGSIAGYKVADLASKLTQAGALVDVVLTASAQRFVTPLTFQAVTGRGAAGARVVDLVDAVMFTGSSRVGRQIAKLSGERMRRVIL